MMPGLTTPTPTPTSSPQPLTIAIIGAGIGGLSTALGLLNHPNLHITIYEAWPNFGDIGAGVAFGPNASRALHMINPKAYSLFWSLATPNLYPGKQDVFFDVLSSEGPRCGETILSMRNSTGQRTFHRAQILEALGSLIPRENCHFGKRVEGIEEGGERIRLRFKDGTEAWADCVIGADGIHSPTRKHVFGYRYRRYEPQFTGTVGYRCLAPMEKAREAIGDEALKSLWVWGRSGPFTMYPIEGGKTLNMVACHVGTGEWEGPWVRPARPGEATEAFGGYQDALTQKALKLMESLEPKAYGLHDLPELPTWVSGNIALIGDAAHASTPFQAAGAGQAVEDALILTRLLKKVENASDLSAALQAYDQIRRPRGTWCAQTSLEAGQLMSMKLPGIMDDTEKYVKETERRQRLVWDIDHDEEISKAERVFKELKESLPVIDTAV